MTIALLLTTAAVSGCAHQPTTVHRGSTYEWALAYQEPTAGVGGPRVPAPQTLIIRDAQGRRTGTVGK